MVKTKKNNSKSKKSKKLSSLFNIEKSLEYKKTLHNNFIEILKYKTSSSCKRKKIEDYKEEVLKFLNILTIKERYELRGSHTFEDHKYPIDIDLSEYIYVDIEKIKNRDYKECYWLTDKISNLIVKLQLRYPDIIFSEFKVGNDYRFHINLGEVDYKNKRILNFDYDKIKKHGTKLYKNKNLTKKEKDYLDKILVKNISINQWNQLESFFKRKYVLRWNMGEMLTQKKILDNGKIVHLQDTFGDETVIKLDTLCFIQDRYKQVTNIFFLFDKKLNKDKQVSVFESNNNYHVYQDIYKYIMEKNFLKVLKRIWLISCSQKIKQNIKILKPVFISKISALGQIEGEIENLTLILDFMGGNILDKQEKEYSFILKKNENIRLITKRFIVHLLDIQNRLYNLLDDNYNDIVTSKISEYFYDNSSDFWETIKNGFKIKHITQLKLIFNEISNFLKRLLNDSIIFYLKKKNTNLNELIERIKVKF
jgi:hypothetical protein